MSRDIEYEAQFLREATHTAERRFGIGTQGFEPAVKRRLELGQERYGNSYLEKNLPLETLEEAWDAAAYAVLEAQKRLGDEDDRRAWHLFEIACHAAAIDFHARHLREPDVPRLRGDEAAHGVPAQ